MVASKGTVVKSISTKITFVAIGAILFTMIVATIFGVVAIREIGMSRSEQMLYQLCESGRKNLDANLDDAEQKIEAISEYVESDLKGLSDEELQAHLDRVGDYFEKATYQANGTVSYYYRIDPAVSQNVKGFWRVNLDGEGFKEYEPTDISSYDVQDTSQLVWFTVPKNTGEPVWLPPYVTDNLDVRVISYNTPVYLNGRFVGVIGIELDYSFMAEQVNNLTLYDGGYAFVNDSQGNLVYHPRMDVLAMDNPPAIPDGLVSDKPVSRYSFNGVEKEAVRLPLINGDWINVSVPLDEINADWQRWAVAIVAVFAVLLVAFIVFITRRAKQITHPLQDLTKAAERIDAGDYGHTLDYKGDDEIGVLTGTFNRLSENLRDTIGDLNDLARSDALTGIRNRMALRRDYDSYQGHEVAVMMVDLDNFKTANDTCGHEEGDRILKETAGLLVDIFGEDHCYRYGGDEFLVIVPDISESEFLERLEALMRSESAISGSAGVTFSIGHVRAELDTSDKLRTLISKADEKMYEVKRDKKNAQEISREASAPRAMASEYDTEELRSFLGEMSEKYDLARVVDPTECRIIEVREDGSVSMNESCYGIWSAEQKCLNCSSAMACRTGRRQEKAERFRDDVYFIQSNPVKLRLPDGDVFDAVVELVSVEKEANFGANDREAENIGDRAAHYLSHHDSLTNVLLANTFYELAREVIKNNPETSWVMITCNIMNFRLVNTLFGDTRGNDVLVRTASALREIAEGASGLCGRLGGDQFALLIPGDRYEERSLIDAAQMLAGTFSSGLYAFCIHFGVYEVDDSSVPVSVMCGRANSALRTIREDMTRTVAYFDDAIRQKLLLEHEVISGFDEALRSGQFKMYLQPLAEKDGAVVGAEALVRWHKPDGTVAMPAAFIGTLENAGLIHRLDVLVWELAVRQLSAWKETPRENLTISINMSAKDFFSVDVYETLTSLVDKYHVDSKLLRLEITETALLVEPEKSSAIVSRLRESGFVVEIDDFGKGYSSLGLLKTIEADVLKLDMSLVREIQDGQRNRAILESVIDLAESLGMEVIAEGVETDQQLRILSEMGCGLFQGYYFSKPVPVDEFEAKHAVVE